MAYDAADPQSAGWTSQRAYDYASTGLPAPVGGTPLQGPPGPAPVVKIKTSATTRTNAGVAVADSQLTAVTLAAGVYVVEVSGSVLGTNATLKAKYSFTGTTSSSYRAVTAGIETDGDGIVVAAGLAITGVYSTEAAIPVATADALVPTGLLEIRDRLQLTVTGAGTLSWDWYCVGTSVTVSEGAMLTVTRTS